jgi:hypothetical protein
VEQEENHKKPNARREQKTKREIPIGILSRLTICG